MRAAKTRVAVLLALAVVLVAGPALAIGPSPAQSPAGPQPPTVWQALWTTLVDSLASLTGADTDPASTCPEGQDCGEIGPGINPDGLTGEQGCPGDTTCGEQGPADGLIAHE